MFGLGVQEIIILVLLGVMVLGVPLIVVVAVLLANRKKREPNPDRD
jgi:hypothetical protein